MGNGLINGFLIISFAILVYLAQCLTLEYKNTSNTLFYSGYLLPQPKLRKVSHF